jgi:hypothetical protein
MHHRGAEILATADLRSANAQIEMLPREAPARRGIRIAQTNEDREGRGG